MRVLVLYNEPVLPADHPDADSEHEILYTVDSVTGPLTEAGFEVSRLGVQRDPAALLTGLRRLKPDVVFNLFEGLADQYGTEAYAAGILEWLGIPYTGCPFQTLCIARDKPWTKRLLRGAGLPTADFFVVEEGSVEECPLEWPVIVKPGAQDASIGLDQNSVVTDLERLNERVAYLLDTYGPPVLVEEFISGREFNIGLIESPDLRTLPVSEIEFVDHEPGYWPLVTYDAKWKPGSRDYEATPAR
jgi:D-alanine-D-alanine ligase